MTNTWTPIPGATVFDPKTGQEYVYRDGEWVAVPEWKGEPSPLDDRRVPADPITPDALRREGWEYMQWNGVVDEWYRQFAPPHYGHSNCVGVRFNEYKGETGPRVYLFLTSSYCRLPGCTTMAQLRALVEMLGGER